MKQLTISPTVDWIFNFAVVPLKATSKSPCAIVVFSATTEAQGLLRYYIMCIFKITGIFPNARCGQADS